MFVESGRIWVGNFPIITSAVCKEVHLLSVVLGELKFVKTGCRIRENR
jgi:hypothetical protein